MQLGGNFRSTGNGIAAGSGVQRGFGVRIHNLQSPKRGVSEERLAVDTLDDDSNLSTQLLLLDAVSLRVNEHSISLDPSVTAPVIHSENRGWLSAKFQSFFQSRGRMKNDTTPPDESLSFTSSSLPVGPEEEEVSGEDFEHKGVALATARSRWRSQLAWALSMVVILAVAYPSSFRLFGVFTAEPVVQDNSSDSSTTTSPFGPSWKERVKAARAEKSDVEKSAVGAERSEPTKALNSDQPIIEPAVAPHGEGVGKELIGKELEERVEAVGKSQEMPTQPKVEEEHRAPVGDSAVDPVRAASHDSRGSSALIAAPQVDTTNSVKGDLKSVTETQPVVPASALMEKEVSPSQKVIAKDKVVAKLEVAPRPIPATDRVAFKGWYIQVVAELSASAAKQRIAAIGGGNAGVQEVPVDGTTYYRVLVGPFADSAKAKEHLSKNALVLSKGGSQPFVKRLP